MYNSNHRIAPCALHLWTPRQTATNVFRKLLVTLDCNISVALDRMDPTYPPAYLHTRHRSNNCPHPLNFSSCIFLSLYFHLHKVLCGDNAERQSSLICLRSLLSLLHPVSCVYILEILIRDSPFPSIRGLLLDIIKWQSQACISSASPKAESALIHIDLTLGKKGEPSWPWLPKQQRSLPVEIVLERYSSSCHQGRFFSQDNGQRVPLLWQGRSSSMYYSTIVLHIFCIPSILKVGNATTRQLLASADEYGGAINLLQHSALKMRGMLASLREDSESLLMELAAFLGWAAQSDCDCHLVSLVDNTARAIADVRSFFHLDVQAAVVLAIEGVKVKVLKIENDLKSQSNFRSRSPWTPDRMPSVAEEASSCHNLSYDMLHLEVILDNLMFLYGVCQTLQVVKPGLI